MLSVEHFEWDRDERAKTRVVSIVREANGLKRAL